MPLPRPTLQTSEELFRYAPRRDTPATMEDLDAMIAEDETNSIAQRISQYIQDNPKTSAGIGAGGLGLMLSPTLRAAVPALGLVGALGYGAKKYGPDAYQYAQDNPKTAAGIGLGGLGLALSPTIRAAVAPLGVIGALGYGATKYGPQAVEAIKENPKTAAGVGLGAATLLSPTVRAGLMSALPAAGVLGAGYGAYKAAPWLYEHALKPAGQFISGLFENDGKEGPVTAGVDGAMDADADSGGFMSKVGKIADIFKGYAELQNAGRSNRVQMAGPVNTQYQPASGIDLSGMLRYIEMGR